MSGFSVVVTEPGDDEEFVIVLVDRVNDEMLELTPHVTRDDANNDAILIREFVNNACSVGVKNAGGPVCD